MSIAQWIVFEDGHGGMAVGQGFAIILTPTGAPNAFTFGTSEISEHTTDWNFGDGATGSCPATDTIAHTYAAPGTYNVSATCHSVTETVVVDTHDPPVTELVVDSIAPATVPIGGPIRLTINGAGFAAPMLVRTWCASTWMGMWDAEVRTANAAVVDIDTTDWPEGTGGLDVVVNGQFSNQLQFAVTAP